MLLTDPSTGQIIDANPSACTFYGYSRAELMGKTVAEINVLTSAEDFEDFEKAECAGAAGRRPVLLRHRLASGEIRDVEVYGRPVTIQGRPVLHSIVHDITERKRIEAQLHKVGRLLRMLSECNHAVVRASVDSELLQENCRIIVEVGGYRMAWVGFAVKDNTKSVQPAAQMGYEDGYLETLRLTWADAERGRGPTGVAIRTGKTCVVKDIAHNPRYALWREEAMRRGYAATIGLPLIDKGRAFGVLNIYAADPDAFDEQEVTLLEELAGDLAYGIMALRTQAEHARVEQALRRERDRAQQYLDIAGVMIVVLNRQGEIVLINRKGCRILGYEEKELLGVDWFESCLPPRAREDVRGEFRRLMAGHLESVGYYEAPVLTRSGVERLVAWHNTIITDETGYIVNCLSSGEDITERRRTEAAIRRKNAHLRALTKRLDEVEDAERRRLAQELHDRVGQSLTALGINLNIIRGQLPEDAGLASACMDDSLLLLDQITECIRSVMTDLRSPVLDDYGLAAALRWYGAQFSARTQIPVEVVEANPDLRLAPQVENALFRIAQEALTNVSKHAQASQVVVSVEARDDVISMVVEDDGIGFDPEHVIDADGRRGWGLLIMTERAGAVGARCRFESRCRGGAKVIVEVAR